MRILAIGLGGAGGRIVDQLYRTDRRSSKVACVQALAVDVDADSIAQLTSIPDTAKICFSPLDLHNPDNQDPENTAIIDINEIAARVHTISSGETDAIILFMGLGGSVVDAAPNLITTLRSSITEPIFALVTLPCRSEGERISAKAADDIEMIAPLLDGVIIFDNETWQKKVKVIARKQSQPDQDFMSKIGLKKRKEPALSPAQKIYSLLNDAIIRRISLILRAGEFKADGGLELAEVVLDSGEILNTMRGMGFITIGYAVEQVPTHPLDFLGRLRPTGYYADEHMKKASRIVDLAKQAIYNEISAPCDITSAHKALVLVAGPSHELSMKGFMTVRKWIDRSIAGLETRSGDYPVTSTKFVAIIIMLSGLENIPRITELKEIRTQFRSRGSEAVIQSGYQGIPVESPAPSQREGLRDEMITLPKEERIAHAAPGSGMSPYETEPDIYKPPKNDESVSEDFPGSRDVVPESPVISSQPFKPVTIPRIEKPAPSIRHLLKHRSTPVVKEDIQNIPEEKKVSYEQERQKIEQELQKQRELAIQGIQKREPPRQIMKKEEEREPSSRAQTRDFHGIPERSRTAETNEPSPLRQIVIKKQTAPKVIIHKKAGRKLEESPKDHFPLDTPSSNQEGLSDRENPTPPSANQADHELLDSWIRDVRSRKKDVRNNEEEKLQIEESPAMVNDDALLHTNLKRIGGDGARDPVAGIGPVEQNKQIKPSLKKRPRMKDEDDISFVD